MSADPWLQSRRQLRGSFRRAPPQATVAAAPARHPPPASPTPPDPRPLSPPAMAPPRPSSPRESFPLTGMESQDNGRVNPSAKRVTLNECWYKAEGNFPTAEDRSRG